MPGKGEPPATGFGPGESVAGGLGVPVLASENGHRPAAVRTCREGDTKDLCAKLGAITGCHRPRIQEGQSEEADDNLAKTADWLLAQAFGQRRKPDKSSLHVQ
jgi:hypothetical protein